MKVQWLLSVPPGLTDDNSTFCPQSAFTVSYGSYNSDYFPVRVQH